MEFFVSEYKKLGPPSDDVSDSITHKTYVRLSCLCHMVSHTCVIIVRRLVATTVNGCTTLISERTAEEGFSN